MNAALGFQRDSRAMLAAVGRRRVSMLARETNDYAAALLGVLRQRHAEWTLEEWYAALAEIDSSTMTVSEFLESESRRTA